MCPHINTCNPTPALCLVYWQVIEAVSGHNSTRLRSRAIPTALAWQSCSLVWFGSLWKSMVHYLVLKVQWVLSYFSCQYFRAADVNGTQQGWRLIVMAQFCLSQRIRMTLPVQSFVCFSFMEKQWLCISFQIWE